MNSDDTNNPLQRRLNIRRGRASGFGGGTSSQSESLRASAEDMEADEVDDAIDPEQVRDRILTQARSNPPDIPPTIPTGPGTEGAPNPRTRMMEVATAGSASYSREYRLSLLHRLLMRNVPLDQIAHQLGVSISTIEKDRIKLKERLREIARGLNIDEIIGGQTEFYNEVAGMALREATDNNTPKALKLASMRTALAANADRTRFLTSAGVFDVLRYRRSEDGSEMSDVQMLMNRTTDALDRLLNSQEPEPEPVNRRARRSRKGGFKEFSMDDADASSSSNEIQEL